MGGGRPEDDYLMRSDFERGIGSLQRSIDLMTKVMTDAFLQRDILVPFNVQYPITTPEGTQIPIPQAAKSVIISGQSAAPGGTPIDISGIQVQVRGIIRQVPTNFPSGMDYSMPLPFGSGGTNLVVLQGKGPANGQVHFYFTTDPRSNSTLAEIAGAGTSSSNPLFSELTGSSVLYLGTPAVVSAWGNTDANGPANGLLGVGAALLAYNDGTNNLERWRNNTQGTLLASAARTAQTPSPAQTNYNAGGVMLTLDITAAPNTAETLTLWLLVVNPVTSDTNDGVLAQLTTSAGTTLQTRTTFRLVVAPGASGAPSQGGNQIVAFALPVPRAWQATINPSGASSWTYSLGYSLLR